MATACATINPAEQLKKLSSVFSVCLKHKYLNISSGRTVDGASLSMDFHIHRFKSYRLKTTWWKNNLSMRRADAVSEALPHKHEGLCANHVKRRVC